MDGICGGNVEFDSDSVSHFTYMHIHMYIYVCLYIRVYMYIYVYICLHVLYESKELPAKVSTLFQLFQCRVIIHTVSIDALYVVCNYVRVYIYIYTYICVIWDDSDCVSCLT